MRLCTVNLSPAVIYILIAIIAGVFITACSQEPIPTLSNTFSCQDEFIERHGTEIWFCGSIEIGDFAKVEDVLLEDGVDSFVISSQGGDGAEARKISSLLRSNNIDVIIDGECLSACAHFVMMAAKRVFINEGAIVAAHSTYDF